MVSAGRRGVQLMPLCCGAGDARTAEDLMRVDSR